MKIVIADRGRPIPAKDYGGTERVIWGLGFELHQLGHQVIFLVPEGSSCPFAKIITYNPALSISSQIPADADLIHLNFPTDEIFSIPYIVTIHGNAQQGEVLSRNSVFVSGDHASRHHSDVFVYNGLLWSDYPKVDLTLPRAYLHFLGKASWKVKNLAGACEIAVKSGNALEVMGGSRWTLPNFKRKPQYSLHPKIHYRGMVNDLEKIKIIQCSRGLVFPVKWDEPFGLALIESLYAGSPVFGYSRGSLPELVIDQVGITSNDTAVLIDAIKNQTFDPLACNKYAVENFSAAKMAKSYVELYEIVLSGKDLNPMSPHG